MGNLLRMMRLHCVWIPVCVAAVLVPGGAAHGQRREASIISPVNSAAASPQRSTGNGYSLSWYSIDSGTVKTSAAGYTLSAVIAQHDTAAAPSQLPTVVPTLTGGGYSLSGGLLHAARNNDTSAKVEDWGEF